MLRRQASACTGTHRNAVVAIGINQNLRHAAGFAFNLQYVTAVDTLGLPQGQTHAAEVVLADAGDQGNPSALAGSGHRGIAALAARADGKTGRHQGLPAAQRPRNA